MATTKKGPGAAEPAGLATVKMPAALRDAAIEVRARVFRDGYDSLPDEVWAPSACFLCGGTLRAQGPGTLAVRCEKCEVTYTNLGGPPSASTMITLGLFDGIKTNALLYVLAQSRRARRKK